MELAQGYKQTEVGVIPKDWNVALLSDLVVKVGSGITPTGGERIYKKEGRPFLRSQNVGWGYLLLDDIAYIDEETHSTFTGTEVQLHDVLLNITGASIGRSAVTDERVSGGNVNQHVCIIRTSTEKLSPQYLNIFLLSENGQKQIDSFQAGGNRQGLNFGQIRSFLLSLPPLPEQRAIAAALSDVDALIRGLDELIAKKRALKQAAMQDLLTGQRRLLGFSGEWEVKNLGEITQSIASGKSKSESKIGRYPLYGSTGIIGWSYRFDYEGVRILVARVGANAGIVNRVSGKFNVSDNTLIITPSNEYDFMFIYYQMIFFNLNSLTFGSGQPLITGGQLRKLYVSFPSLLEQTAIAVILSDMDSEITALEEQRDKTHALKQGMMQELLTGKTRLV